MRPPGWLERGQLRSNAQSQRADDWQAQAPPRTGAVSADSVDGLSQTLLIDCLQTLLMVISIWGKQMTLASGYQRSGMFSTDRHGLLLPENDPPLTSSARLRSLATAEEFFPISFILRTL